MTEDEAAEQSELLKVRSRLHRLNDTVQKHELDISENRIRLELHAKQLASLNTIAATREQVDTVAREFALRMDPVIKDLDTIKKGIYWLIGIVLGGVLVAVLSLVIKS